MSVTDILGMSFSASVIILLILVIRKTLSDKISGRMMAALWLIPAAKLLIPYTRFFYTALNSLLPASGARTEYTVSSEVLSGSGTVCTVIAEERAVPFMLSLGLEPTRAAAYIWLLGAVFTGALYVFRHIKFRRKFACSLNCGYDISELKNTFGIKRKVTLRVSEFADTPFTYGVFGSVIILPKITDFGNEAQLKNILRHELTHIKRSDVLFKALLAVCTAAHWFNPLVWIMFSFAARDIELACDETAVRRGKASPEEYALALIGTEERRCLYQTACWGGGKLEERIIGIMSRKNARRGLSAFALICVLAAALVINVAASIDTEETVYAVEAVTVSEDRAAVGVTEAAEAGSIIYGTAVYALSYDDVMIAAAEKHSFEMISPAV